MSLFQCENCGCVENTACSSAGFKHMQSLYRWDGIEHLKGKMLCSACGPTKYSDGVPTKFGKWHDRFKRKYIPIGEFVTNNVGNLVHKDTGECYTKYIIKTHDTEL